MRIRFRTAIAALAGLGAAAATMVGPAPEAQALDDIQITCNVDGTICGPPGTFTTITMKEFGFFFGESWRNRRVTRIGLVGRERPLKSYGSPRSAWQAKPPALTGGSHKTREHSGRAVARNGYFSPEGWNWREQHMGDVAAAGHLVETWVGQGKVVLPGLPAGHVPAAGQDLVEVLYNPYDPEFSDPDYLLDMLFLGGLRTKTVGELSWAIPNPQVVTWNNRVYHRIVAKIYTPLEVTYARVEQNCNLQPFAIVAPGTTVDITAGVTGMSCRAPSGSPMTIQWDPWSTAAPLYGATGTRQDGTGLTYRAHYTVDPYNEGSAPTDGKKDVFIGRLIAADQTINVRIPIEVHITNRPRCTTPATKTVQRGSSIFVPVTGLCTDVDTQQWGEPLVLEAASAHSAPGTVEFTTDAQGVPGFKYTPANTYAGPAQVTVRAKDQLGSTSKPVTVDFDVVHPEIVCPALDGNHVYENWVPVDVDVDCYLENGAPTLGIPFSFEIGDPRYGSVSNIDTAAGTFTYRSDDPNAHPFDSVRVVVRWGTKTLADSYQLTANCGIRACEEPPPAS